MAITERSIIPPGSRVEVTRSRIPTDPALVGRKGTVVMNSQYYPTKVEVQLDGDPEIRAFAPEELLVAATPAALPPDEVAARKRLARP